MVFGTRCTHRRQKTIGGETYCDDARGRCGRIALNANGRWVLTSSLEKKDAGSPEGTCQVCFKAFKVPDGKLVALHGYQRPGDGAIHGRCWGAQHPPFEFENARTKWYLGELVAAQVRKEARLKQLAYPGPETLVYRRGVMDMEGVLMARGAAAVGVPYTKEWVPSFEDVRAAQERALASELGMLRATMDTVRMHLAAWKPRKLLDATAPRAPTKSQVARQKAREAREAKRAQAAEKKAKLREKRIQDAKPRVHVLGHADGSVSVVKEQKYTAWPSEREMVTRAGDVPQLFVETAPGLLLAVVEFFEHKDFGRTLQWSMYLDASLMEWTPTGRLDEAQAAWRAWEARQGALA